MEEKYMLKNTKWTTATAAVLLGTGIASTNHVQADTVNDAQSNTQVVQNSNQSQRFYYRKESFDFQ